jgi:hypothetical protein
MWHLKVPKILHVYWGGGALPYMRYLTVKSFMDLNPDWEVYVWTPKEHNNKVTWKSGENDYISYCRDYLPYLLQLPVIHSVLDFNDYGFTRQSAEVHKADYTRIAVMKYYGGVWADMDIIFFRPIEDIYVNKEEYENKEVFACIAHYGHSTGFLMTQPESRMFNVLGGAMAKEFSSGSYQCIGPDLFNKYFRNKVPNGVNLSMDVVYSHDALNQGDLITLKKARFTDRSIGCHWYGGHPMWRKFIKDTNGGLENLPDNIIGNLIKDGQLRNTPEGTV